MATFVKMPNAARPMDTELDDENSVEWGSGKRGHFSPKVPEHPDRLSKRPPANATVNNWLQAKAMQTQQPEQRDVYHHVEIQGRAGMRTSSVSGYHPAESRWPE